MVVTITADSHHKLLEVDAHMEGEGSDEPVIARKPIRKLERKGKKVNSHYGNGKFDTNAMFNFLDKRDIEPKIPVHINASSRSRILQGENRLERSSDYQPVQKVMGII